MDAIKELAKDLGMDPKMIDKWAKAERLPVKLPKQIAERVACIKAEKITRSAGLVH